jgi:hypothetical protein
VKRPPPAAQNKILVGFAEGHIFYRQNSPLAHALSEAQGHSRIGVVF